MAADIPAVAALLAEQARRTDAQGLSPEALAALSDADAFAPDLATDLPALLGLSRALARVCPASAWLVVEAARAATLAPAPPEKPVGTGPRALGAEVLGHADMRREGDGWRVSGAWRAPAVDGLESLWIEGAGTSAPTLRVPLARFALSWPAYFGGLRGVGWREARLDHALLPDAETASPPPPRGAWLIGAVLGCAEGGLDDYVRMTRARVSGIGGERVAGFTQVQARLAESETELKAAALLFERVRAGAGDAVEADSDRAFIARSGLAAVTRLVRQMGAMGLAETNPVQRRYRDLRALAAAYPWDAPLAARGRALLGLSQNAA